jgi:hypothetical protein
MRATYSGGGSATALAFMVVHVRLLLLPVVATMPPDRPMHGHVGPRPSVEAVMPVVPAPMMWEPQIVAVLRTSCGIGPNATIPAVKSHHREISACRTCCAEAESHEGNC